MTKGHAVLPHTADVQIEAWASSPGDCYAEAIAAFVETFAEVGDAGQERAIRVELGPARPEVLLVLLLEEVLLHLEVERVLPVEAQLDASGERLVGTLSMADVDSVSVTGAIPKGISYYDLRFGRDHGQWRCRATVDV